MNKKRVITYGLASVSIMASGMVGITSFADGTDVVDEINITVPVSCTLEGTGMNSHNAEILNGQYNSSIGETTLKAYCNDNEGFAIYAIGYTDNLNGKNVLTSSVLGSTHDIVTGTSTTGANSNWAMKLSTVSSPVPTYPIIIAGSSDDTERESGDPDFTSFQQIPNDYTLVAKRTSGTDIGTNAEGSTLKTTYQAYISQTQPAGTYTGQVKYTLIHPHDESTPPSSMLLTGPEVNIKMKSLASGTTVSSTTTFNTNIKSIKMANSLPADFEPSEANTVSTPDSKYPIYIFFDDTNNAGIMYFYTESDTVVMNPDSSSLFRNYSYLSDISGLADWDASYVSSMAVLFARNGGITSLSALANWDTSSLSDIRGAFSLITRLTSLNGLENWNVSKTTSFERLFVGDSALTDISALANWDTSNVTSLYQTFAPNDPSAITSLHGLESWDTSKVTNMDGTFANMTSLTDISALSNWDTGSVTRMVSTFNNDRSLTSVAALKNWDTSNVTTMRGMLGQDNSLTSIDVSNWNTSNVTDMATFYYVEDDYDGTSKLTSIIGLNNLDVSSVKDMSFMFYGAAQITHYDIDNWDVSKVESFNHMFADNYKLENLNLSKWDVSSVKTMYDMFDDNHKLTTIGDVSQWNTASLIDASGFLNGSTSFVGDNGVLDLSGWNTSKLKGASEMFRATKLETIDMSGWTFDAITNSAWSGAGSGIYYAYGTGLGTVFQDTARLQTVYLSQSGLDSFNTAVNRGINTTDMWTGSNISGFTVK